MEERSALTTTGTTDSPSSPANDSSATMELSTKTVQFHADVVDPRPSSSSSARRGGAGGLLPQVDENHAVINVEDGPRPPPPDHGPATTFGDSPGSAGLPPRPPLRPRPSLRAVSSSTNTAFAFRSIARLNILGGADADASGENNKDDDDDNEGSAIPARFDLQTGRRVTRCQSVQCLKVCKEAGDCRWRRLWKKRPFSAKTTTTSGAAGPGSSPIPEAEREEESSSSSHDGTSTNGSGEVDEEHRRAHKVYRIRSHPDRTTTSDYIEDDCKMGASSISEYIRWTFRASFFEVTLASYVEFLVLIVVFAFPIWAVGVYQPLCIFGGEFTIESDSLAPSFVDAFHLSWTTLSTVGFGIIAPQVDPSKANGSRCYGINILMAIESFVGVLFGGILGAILVGKVARVQSVAQVAFSDPICVRYGTGVMVPQECDGDDGDEGECWVGGADAANNNADNDAAAAGVEDPSSPTAAATAASPRSAAPPLEIPCPILEFRIANELACQHGGEIMNASVHVVATTLAEIDEAELCDDKEMAAKLKHGQQGSSSNHLLSPLNKAAGFAAGTAAKAAGMAAGLTLQASKHGACAVGSAAKHTGAALFGASRMATQATGSVFQRINYRLGSGNSSGSVHSSSSAVFAAEEEDGEASPEPEPVSTRELERAAQRDLAQRLLKQLEKERSRVGGVSLREELRTAVTVDEGNSTLSPRRVFHKLEMETDAHPYFKRVWNMRHRLDEESPLLSLHARRAVAANNGFWPEEWNDHEAVRKHLRFTELIVSFSGTANASGSTVYAQKVYDFADVNIGFTFAPMLHMSPCHRLIVDRRLLNDVVEQNGGGAEPFQNMIDPMPDSFAGLAVEAQESTLRVATHAREVANHALEKTVEAANHVRVRSADLAQQTKAKADETLKMQRGSLGSGSADDPQNTLNVKARSMDVNEDVGLDVEAGDDSSDCEKKGQSP